LPDTEAGGGSSYVYRLFLQAVPTGQRCDSRCGGRDTGAGSAARRYRRCWESKLAWCDGASPPRFTNWNSLRLSLWRQS